MIRILLCLTILAGLGTARADESRKPEAVAPPPPAAVDSEAKSFFDCKTLTDIQQLVHFDAKLLKDDAASGGAG